MVVMEANRLWLSEKIKRQWPQNTTWEVHIEHYEKRLHSEGGAALEQVAKSDDICPWWFSRIL